MTSSDYLKLNQDTSDHDSMTMKNILKMTVSQCVPTTNMEDAITLMNVKSYTTTREDAGT